MIDHLSSYATDFVVTKRFYDTVLPGLDEEFPSRRIAAWGAGGKPVFWVIEVREAASPRHVAFRAESRAAVDAFYAAALAVSAPDHGAPGLRPQYHEHYYAAFVLDPDGNNVEAVCGQPDD